MMFVEFFKKGVGFLKNINVIPQPALRISFIILSITLTVILISSPVIAVFPYSLLLSPIALRVEFASATSSENNDDNNEEEEQPNTDATTDGEEEVDGDSGDDVQEEQQEVQDGEEEEEQQEQQQLATVVGEICDDFEDNDGDGLIDLADVEDCAAPLTQGTVTAPTTPPPPSVTNTTATNSTNNTLTASEITTPPSTDDEASGITTGNTVYDADGRPVYDLEKDCESYEELKIPPPPLGFGQPPDAKWYHCPPGVGVWVTPNGTSSLGTGGGEEEGGGQQQQQQSNSPSSCPPKPTNYYYTAPARIISVQLPSSPSSTPPPSSSPQTPPTTNPCPPGESSSSTATPPPPQPPLQASPPSNNNNPSQGGGQQGQVQQPPPLQQGQQPGTTSPGSPTTIRNPDGGTAYTFPNGISITKHPDDWGHANIPDKGVSITFGSRGSVDLVDYPDGQLSRDSEGGATAVFRNMDPLFSHSIQLRPDGTGVLILVDGTEITGKGSTLTITKPVTDPNTGVRTGGSITTTYSPDGNVATQNPDGSTTNAKIGSVIGETTTTFADGISITKGPGGRVYTEIHDKGVIIRSGSSGSVDLVDYPDGQLSRDSDGGATALFPNRDSLTILPDGTGKVELKDNDDTVITSKDYTLTITKPVTDPKTGVKTGESMTTYTPPH